MASGSRTMSRRTAHLALDLTWRQAPKDMRKSARVQAVSFQALITLL